MSPDRRSLTLTAARMMLARQPLFPDGQYMLSVAVVVEQAHKSPVANMVEIAHFLGRDICNRQILSIGIMSSTKSETIFMIADDRLPAFEFMHVPGRSGVQIFSRGTQANMRKKMQAM